MLSLTIILSLDNPEIFISIKTNEYVWRLRYRRVRTKNGLPSAIIVCLLIIGGFIGFTYFGSDDAKGTDVGGPINTDTIWDLAGSPYIVVDDVTVGSSAILTIEPRVMVKFDGYYSIYVDGNLEAVGNEMNRIIIMSNMAMPAEADWRACRSGLEKHSDKSQWTCRDQIL
jgi:hypothetical protein